MSNMSRIITAAVEEEAEKGFRSAAMRRYGKKKGSYGKALSEAMRVWARDSAGANEEILRMLRAGLHMGKVTYKSRDELHER